MHLTLYYKKSIRLLFLSAVLFFTAKSGNAQLTANFSATPLSGCAPLAVSFQDLSTGSPTSRQWDLGNGTLSTQPNPNTIYFLPGVYTVTLTVSNASGSSTITRTQYITVNDKPAVAFTASDSTGCFPLRVNFTDFSVPGSGTISNWEWDFGDGTTSSVANPFHIYSTAGNYTVTLKVTNSTGCVRVVSKPQYIRVSTGVVVNFTNTPGLLCKPPEVINFTNGSTGPGTLTHQWLFGDATSSTVTSPSHTYLAGGTYTVTLITQSSLGCVDTLIRPAAVTIRDVQASFFSPDSVCVNNQALFINTSVPAPASNNWDFGDGSSSNISTTGKIWLTPGFFPVQLINNYGTCTDTLTKIIKVLALPAANFTSNDSIDCDAPFTVNFQDLSAGAASWRWSFGDGNTSNQQNPSHTYTSNGSYTVKLIVTNASGCRDSLTKTQYIRIQKPITAITGAPTEGCIPFTFSPTPNINSLDGVATYLWDFGDGATSSLQSPTHIYPIQGTYTVKLFITTNDGCSDSVIVTDGVRVGTLPTADFSAVPLAQCVGQTIQFNDLSVPADRWLWDFGDVIGSSTAQNPIYAYSDTGTFTIRLTVWNNGCSTTVTKTNLITALPPVSRFTAGFTCNNKRQVIFTDNSVLPQTWSWDFGDGSTSVLQNPAHTYTAFGNYTVTLTVTNGSCSHTSTQSVNLINELSDFNVIQDTVCKLQQAVFVVAASVNPANISNYAWDFGDGTLVSGAGATVVGQYYQTAGVYTVKLVLTDTRGCKDSVVKVNLMRVWGPTSNFTPSPLTGCKGLTVNFADQSVTDGTHPITNWLWYYGDGQTTSAAGPPFSHIYNTAGSFTASLKVTDSFGCTDSAAFATPVFVTDPKAGFGSADTLACINSPVTFADSSIGNTLTYNWTFGNGNTSTLAAPGTSYPADGNYTVKLVVTDINGCKDSLTRTDYIKVRTSRASFTVNDSISSCSPFEVVFTNTSVNSIFYNWSFDDGTTSTLPNPTKYYTTPGTYRVRLLTTGPGGCSDSSFINIILYPSTATLTYTPLAGCSPLPVNFTVSTPGPVTYLWDFNDGNTLVTTNPSLVYNYLLPGDFVPKVLLEDQTGCLIPVTGIDTIRVTRSTIKFKASDSLFCDRGLVTFTDSTFSNAVITNYFWTFGDGGTSAAVNPVHQYLAPGLYTVQLIIRTANGCEDTLTKPNYIKIVANPQVSVGGDTSACIPASLLFTGNLLVPDTSALSWQWTFGNGNSSSLQNPPVQQYPTVGSYLLQLIVSNSTGCADTVGKTIVIHPLPTTNAGNDTTLCLGTPLQLQATGADSYQWVPATNLSCTLCPDPFTSTPVEQLYYVTGSSVFGCQTTDSVLVRVKRPFRITVIPSADSLCTGQQVTLRASAAENYQWSPPAGLSSTTTANPVASPSITTQYKLLAYDSANCFRDSAFVNISVFPYPAVDAGPDKIIPVGSGITLSPAYSGDVVRWQWLPPAGLTCTNCPSPVASPKNNTTYTIVATNNGGCISTDKVTIIVTCGGENVFIPNAFSPNGDGVNDVFLPRGRGIFRIQSMRIFSRWGETVYARTNFLANDLSAGWNGKYKNVAANPDVYTYIIEVICDNSEVIPFTGNILLLR